MGGGSAFIDHADAIGSTTMETGPAGAVLWDVVNGPWGQVWQQTGTRQSQVFAGMDWQVNDPLMPSATREYNDGLGRWMTPDPGGLASAVESDPQTWNEYAYALNNPLRYTDTLGGTPQDRVNAAYKLVMTRIPYLSGGKNASPCVGGLDCSGFVEAVFQADPDNRIKALDTIQNAASQWKDLTAGGQTSGNISEARLGDAIFFKNITTGKISHVGIVVATSKSYISFADEANSIAGARIEIMNRAHTQWGTSETFAGVGRPIESVPRESQAAQQQASSGLMGGLAGWLEEVFLGQVAPSAPRTNVQSYLCGGSNEPPCAQ